MEKCPVEVKLCWRNFCRVEINLSTVLAQDHFFSDSLSLHLTIQTHKGTMMMLLGVSSKISTSVLCCRFDESRGPPSLNGRVCEAVVDPGPGEVKKLGSYNWWRR